MTTHKENLETAAEQAAGWLPHAGSCEVRPERDCTCWQPRGNLMRAALEDVMPALLAQAWEDGEQARYKYERAYRVAYDFGDPAPEAPVNPYTAEAQVLCGVHKDWGLQQTCTLGRDHLGQHEYGAQVDGL